MTCLPVIKIPLNEALSFNHSPPVLRTLHLACNKGIMKTIPMIPKLVMSTINNLVFRHNDGCPPVGRLVLSRVQTVVRYVHYV